MKGFSWPLSSASGLLPPLQRSDTTPCEHCLSAKEGLITPWCEKPTLSLFIRHSISLVHRAHPPFKAMEKVPMMITVLHIGGSGTPPSPTRSQHCSHLDSAPPQPGWTPSTKIVDTSGHTRRYMRTILPRRYGDMLCRSAPVFIRFLAFHRLNFFPLYRCGGKEILSCPLMVRSIDTEPMKKKLRGLACSCMQMVLSPDM